MLIRVRDIDGTVFSLDAEPSDTIEGIKSKIQDQIGLPPDQQTISYSGVTLVDGRSLADYNVPNNGLIVLALVARVSITSQCLTGSFTLVTLMNNDLDDENEGADALAEAMIRTASMYALPVIIGERAAASIRIAFQGDPDIAKMAVALSYAFPGTRVSYHDF